MKLFAVLCWYDESPTWLAGCVSSLSRIGVDHVIAVDGRYPHFQIGSPAASLIEQSDVIVNTAAACGMGVTLHRPVEARLTESQKRELCHKLVELIATPHEDWFIVIDGDEYVSDAEIELKRELASMQHDSYVAALRVANAIDPNAAPGADNDVQEKTAQIHRNLPVDTVYASLQSRAWRVLEDMRVGPAHHHYTGLNREGVEINMRPDMTGDAPPGDLLVTDVEIVNGVTITHRKNWRTSVRRSAKTEYYELRDRIGLERVAT